MTSYAHVTDGTIDRVGLPRTGTLADGRTVSGYDRLPPKILAAEGWAQVVDDGPPKYDPATHQAVRTLEVVDGIPTATYRIEELPPAEPDPDVELADAIRAAATLEDLKAALVGSAPGASARAAGRRADR